MDVELVAQVRTKTGKGAARSLRREDKVPAVVYGPKSASIPLSLSAKHLEKLLREMGEESKLLNLTLEDGNNRQVKQVMIREIQKHPVRRQLVHVDFYEVAMDQPIVVEVPVELTGKAAGEEKGGIVNQVRRTLSVRCLPGEIPEKVLVDISSLDVGEAIHVGDLVKQVAFDLTEEQRLTVVTINAPEGAAQEEVEEGAETEEGEEVKK